MRSPLMLLALGGCVASIAPVSSRTLLGPAQSGAVTAHDVDDTSRELTHLFEVRRYAMVDQHLDTPDGERLLKYQYMSGSYVGSVFYAWVTPVPGGSTVSLLGKPTFGGDEPCTNDGVALACVPIHVDVPAGQGAEAGQGEAAVAHAVLAQLALEGYAIRPLPADAPAPTGDPAVLACKADRRAQLLQAVSVKDPDAKRAILEHLPSC